MNAEEKLVKVLSDNEHVVHILPLDELKQEWLDHKGLAKAAAPFAAHLNDSAQAAKIINEFGIRANKVLIKSYAGKEYVILKGYAGARKVLTGRRYLTSNPKVVRMAVGPKGIAKSVKGGFVLTVILSVGIEVFDYFIRDSSTLSQLLGTITGDLIKIGLGSIAALAAGLAVGATAIVGTVAAAPILAAIAVGMLAGYLLDKIDERMGATRALIEAYAKLGHDLKNIEYETKRWLNIFETNPCAVMRMFGGHCSYGGY